VFLTSVQQFFVLNSQSKKFCVPRALSRAKAQLAKQDNKVYEDENACTLEFQSQLKFLQLKYHMYRN